MLSTAAVMPLLAVTTAPNKIAYAGFSGWRIFGATTTTDVGAGAAEVGSDAEAVCGSVAG